MSAFFHFIAAFFSKYVHFCQEPSKNPIFLVLLFKIQKKDSLLVTVYLEVTYWRFLICF